MHDYAVNTQVSQKIVSLACAMQSEQSCVHSMHNVRKNSLKSGCDSRVIAAC